MKSIFDPGAVGKFLTKIEQLDDSSLPKWGKMNVYQMLKHCAENESMLLRETKLRRVFLGRLFGQMALKSRIKDDEPLKKNTPTHPDLIIKGEGNVEDEKNRWIAFLLKYSDQTPVDYNDFIHPFFGKMNREQVGILAFKHIDHHLRQFGV